MLDILFVDFQIMMKVVFIIITLLYLVFAVIVVKQVKLMSETITLHSDRYLIALSYLHLIAAFIAFVLTIFLG